MELEISKERGRVEEIYQHSPAGRKDEHFSSFYPKAPGVQEPKRISWTNVSGQFTLLTRMLSLYN